MILVPLQSGSTGNCIYVRTSDAALLFDAGISGACASSRLALCGQDLSHIDALFITHEHSDHIKYARVFAKKHHIPIYISEKTFQRAKRRFGLEELEEIRIFRVGDVLIVNGAVIQSIPTPHDAIDGCVYVVQDQLLRVGIFTDLGHVFPELEAIVPTLDGIYIESNYDPGTLKRGSYPAMLKRRITGPGGHISNIDATRLLAKYSSPRLQWVCLGHLSEENNSPELALETARAKLGRELPIAVASRCEAGPIFQTSHNLFNLEPIRSIATQHVAEETFSYQLELFPQDLASLG